MGLEDEVLRVAKKLTKMTSNGTSEHAVAMDLLNCLKGLNMTLDVLQRTRIGMLVNNFRKASNNDEVIALSKSLIKSWKKLLPDSSPSNPPSRTNSTASLNSMNDDSHALANSNSDGKPTNMEQESANVPDRLTPDSSSETSNTGDQEVTKIKKTCLPNRTPETTDVVRLKCREMLSNALKLATSLEGAADPVEMGNAIEEAIYQEFKNTDTKYKTRIRSRVANLRDNRNPKLRENCLLGLINAERLATMTSEEMASDEMKNLRAKLTKESIDDHQMTLSSGTKTDLFKCGRCKQSNCTYNQVQTRSADEPMTTFVYCMECGNRWKFC